MKNLFRLMISMFKVGTIGFGGGNALIPVIQQEAVEEKKLITRDEYEKDIIAATLTPGALPVEIASGVGKKAGGLKGMILGGTVMALPGAALTVLLLAGMNMVGKNVLIQIQYASIGITAFIMCLLTEYIRGTFENYIGTKNLWKAFLVCLAVFLLTAGKNIYKILQIEAAPVFSISTIDMLAIAFFGILVTNCKFTWQNLVPAGIVSFIYLLCVGKAGIIQNEIVTWTVRGVMIILSIYSIKKSKIRKKKNMKAVLKPVLKESTVWFIFAVLLSLPAFLQMGIHTASLGGSGLASSLISFGGGDAYLTIADGLFVPDYISEKVFYNNLVLIVNVLPGSILCKTLSGIGYAYGNTLGGGSHLSGCFMALTGFACSVAASCGVFGVIYHLYEYLESVEIFINIKKSIKIIVSGMLMTVMAGLIQTSMEIGKGGSYPWFTILIMIFGIYGLDVFLFRKAKCKNIILIGMSLVLSMGICNAMGI